MIRTTLDRAETVIWELSGEVHEHLRRPKAWDELTEEILWTELVACILGSQVKWEHASSALQHLKSKGLLDLRLFVSNLSVMEGKIGKELSMPIYAPLRKHGAGSKYRFPNTKARQICRSAAAVYGGPGSLAELLRTCSSDHDARAILVRTCSGVGPKQASLFLRNIGYSNSLAIIDSQVLKFMEKKGLASRTDAKPRTIRGYLELESRFSRYAEQVGASPGDLDVAVWAVMRVAEVR